MWKYFDKLKWRTTLTVLVAKILVLASMIYGYSQGWADATDYHSGEWVIGYVEPAENGSD